MKRINRPATIGGERIGMAAAGVRQSLCKTHVGRKSKYFENTRNLTRFVAKPLLAGLPQCPKARNFCYFRGRPTSIILRSLLEKTKFHIGRFAGQLFDKAFDIITKGLAHQAQKRILNIVIPVGLLVSCVPSEQVEFRHDPPSNQSVLRNDPIKVFPAASLPGTKTLKPYIEHGTGTYVAKGNSNNQPKPAIEDGNTFRINMVDVEIVDVIEQILGERLNLDYVIDPKVKGRITIRTSSGLPADDILSILDSVLNLNGAALIEDDGLYRIVPIDQILNTGITPEVRPVGNVNRVGFGVEIVPIRFIDVDSVVEILQPLLSSDSTVRINGRRNTVLLVGPRDELETLIETIRIFDVDWMRGMSFGLFDLEYANAMELVEELRQVFNEFEGDKASSTVRFVPIKRLNAIVVVTSQPAYLERTRTWIGQLDRPSDDNEEQVFIYSVQNGRASEIAKILSSIFDIENAVVSNKNRSESGFSLAPGLDSIEFQTSYEVDDEEFEAFAEEQYQQQFPRHFQNEGSKSEARIVADEINNSLLIRTTPANFEKIKTALIEIDVQPVQVLLEATIAEVTLKDELSYGIQWFFRFGSSNITLSELTNGSVEQAFAGFSGLFSNHDVRAVFNALDSVSDIQIVSSPQILVLDNQTAQLEVGDEVPIVTQQSQSIDGDNDRLFNTVEQRQTGVILNVTPRVNASGLVVLDIQQEVSDVIQTTTSGIDSPTISQRRIGTSIAVGNHQTVALGGLIRDRADQAKQGVPFLSRIPVFGALFGANNNRVARTELLVLITPKVIRNYGDAQAVTDELRRRFQSLSPLERKLSQRLLN